MGEGAEIPHDAEDPERSHNALSRRLANLEHAVGAGAARVIPAWRRRTHGEPRWPAALAVLTAIGLQLSLPSDLTIGPRPLMPAIEGLLFTVLVIANPTRINRESKALRLLGIALVAVVSAATAWSAAALAVEILTGETPDAPVLLLHGAAVWLLNVIVFALWYWEADRGGPAARAAATRPYPDFLFAEMSAPSLVKPDWEPAFVDYLYLSFTNASAFSPTDTMPLTRWAKLTMMGQAVVSLVTVALVVARAVNILT
jgi:uncharacterized membrane protein